MLFCVGKKTDIPGIRYCLLYRVKFCVYGGNCTKNLIVDLILHLNNFAVRLFCDEPSCEIVKLAVYILKINEMVHISKLFCFRAVP